MTKKHIIILNFEYLETQNYLCIVIWILIQGVVGQEHDDMDMNSMNQAQEDQQQKRNSKQKTTELVLGFKMSQLGRN